MPVYIYTLSDSRSPDTVRYIGKSIDPSRRFKSHQQASYLKDNTYKSRWINKVIKSGAEILMNIIDTVEDTEWVYWEKYWIEQFKAWGFKLVNTTLGGDGIDLTPEIIKKRNLSNTGKPCSEEKRQKISEKLRGEKNPFFGKKHDIHKRELMTLKIPHRKPVQQFDLEGNLLNTFVSFSNAAKSTKSCVKTVRNSCNSGKPGKGFIWKYAS